MTSLLFEVWKDEVDAHLSALYCGFDSEDMIDWNWLDAFEDGLTPDEAVEAYIEDIGDDLL